MTGKTEQKRGTTHFSFLYLLEQAHPFFNPLTWHSHTICHVYVLACSPSPVPIQTTGVKINFLLLWLF